MTGVQTTHGSERPAELLQHIRCAVVQLTADLDVDAMNPEAERTFGARAEEVRRQRFIEQFVPTDARRAVSDALERAAEGGEGHWSEGTFLARDGVQRRLMWLPVPVDEPHGLLLISQDVTVLRAAESQVRELEEAVRERRRLADLGAIAAKIVHDLGGPVTVISALSAWLVAQVEHQPETPAGTLLPSLGDIQVAAERMRSMLRGCLQVTRDQQLRLASVELDALLREVGSSWAPEAERRGITLEIDADAGVWFRADAEKLRRVLDNLVQNALEAIDRGPGRVEVRGMRDSRGVVITVGDTGPGIPPGLDLYGLFETTKQGGTGLGLAIAKELVASHGGRLHHAPRRPQGALFTIELLDVRIAGADNGDDA